MKWDELTPEQIECLAAEKVMGWTLKRYTDVPDIEPAPDWVKDNRVMCEVGSWSPSENMSDAWEVIEELQKPYTQYPEDFIQLITTEDGWHCEFTRYTPSGEYEYTSFSAEASTAREAICKAAFKAVGVDIE